MPCMKVLGIDEAGRGPIVGAMVMAGVMGEEEKFRAMGAKDSKMLSPRQRERLFDQIIAAAAAYKIILIPPAEIDEAVLSKKHNLNWLEADHTAAIIEELKPDKVIIDCPSNNIKQYVRYLSSKLSYQPEIVMEHQADVNYPIVGAASILAKVTRDREIKKIEEKVGPLGSGYMSDPVTQEFLKRHYEKFPEIFRKSWKPYKKTLDGKNQKSLGEF